MSKFFSKGFFIGFLVAFVAGWFLFAAYIEERLFSFETSLILPTVITAFVGGLTGNVLGYLWERSRYLPVIIALIVATLFSSYSYAVALVPGEAGEFLKILSLFPGILLGRIILPPNPSGSIVFTWVILISGFFWTYLGLGVGYVLAKRKK